jgi:uncharacterized protein (TIGR00255 family)
MIQSMTAFGRAQAETPWGVLVWELRSVNHRYLETAIRMPEDLRGLEAEARSRIADKLNRGKVDAGLRLQREGRVATEFEFNTALVDRVLAVADQVRERAPDIAPLTAAEVLQWPGVLKAPEVDMDALGSATLAVLDEALDALVAMRRREGEKLAALIVQRLDNAAQVVRDVRAILPEVVTRFRERLETRLAEIRDQLDPARLEQEVVLFATRSDVDEELDRLEAHIAEVRRLVEKAGPVGRRLDFLMQELNREANTLGSKASDLRLTNASVELKVLIEQIREQIQNIE